MDTDIWFDTIKKLAVEQNFKIEGDSNQTICTIYIDKWHAVAYQLKKNQAGYIQANQWECDRDGANPRFGRAVYSIRSSSDCAPRGEQP